MSTIYVWTSELSADTTGASADYVMYYDTSAGTTKKCRLGALPYGENMAFYGATAIDQPTMTATALTALATATVSAANSTGVYGFASSTVGAAYIKRMSQIQADLELLMARIDSTGLVNIAAV